MSRLKGKKWCEPASLVVGDVGTSDVMMKPVRAVPRKEEHGCCDAKVGVRFAYAFF